MISLNRKARMSNKVLLPGDKSISHRALLLGAIAQGETRISNLLESDDITSTACALRQLGVKIFKPSPQHAQRQSEWIIQGIEKFLPPDRPLDCGNSGTTLRLLMGLLAGQPFTSVLLGDSSLLGRPMDRVKAPLELMGARIELREDRFAPVKILPSSKALRGISYRLPVASAQVKSAILLAGLFAEGQTTVIEPVPTRDHTERLLRYFGSEVTQEGAQIGPQISLDTPNRIALRGGQKLIGRPITIPGDPSSAAFLIAGALIQKRPLELENVLLNPTRIGYFKVLERMGARIEVAVTESFPEPVGTVRIHPSGLRGTQISRDEVPSLIDELPVLAVLAAYAEGNLCVEGASELRVKETDRIRALGENFARLGVPFEERADGFQVQGGHPFRSATVDPLGDHRIAMAFAVGALGSEAVIEITNESCASVSFPGFFNLFER